MPIVFWEIHRIARYWWLPKDSTLGSPLFHEEVLRPLAQKMRPNSKKARKRLTLIHRDNAKVHRARATQEKLAVSRFKRTPQPPYGPDIAPSDSFFLVGWKSRWNGVRISSKMNYPK
jgi:transposase